MDKNTFLKMGAKFFEENEMTEQIEGDKFVDKQLKFTTISHFPEKLAKKINKTVDPNFYSNNELLEYTVIESSCKLSGIDEEKLEKITFLFNFRQYGLFIDLFVGEDELEEKGDIEYYALINWKYTDEGYNHYEFKIEDQVSYTQIKLNDQIIKIVIETIELTLAAAKEYLLEEKEFEEDIVFQHEEL